MSKQASDSPRSNYFLELPKDLTPPAKDCLFYDPRIEDPADEAMVADLLENGCRELLKARKEGETADGKPILVIVDGRRRYKAGLRANELLAKQGKEELRLKVQMVRGTDAEMFELMVQSNLGRKDDGPVRSALKMQRYEKMGKSKKEIALLFQCSLGTVDNRLALLELHEDVQAKVESGEISEMVARGLTSVERGKQAETAQEMVTNGMHKGNGAERAVAAAKNGKKIPKKDPKKNGKKMRSRAFLESWATELGKKGGLSATAAAAVRFALGNDRALKDFPTLKAAAEKVLS